VHRYDSEGRIFSTIEMKGTPVVKLFWDLPEVLAHSLFLSWMDIEDVGNVDTAMCSKLQRSHWIAIISGTKFVVRTDLRTPCLEISPREKLRANRFTVWILKRQVAVAKLRVTPTFVGNRIASIRYLRRHGNSINQVTEDSDTDATTASDYIYMFKALCFFSPNVTNVECAHRPTVHYLVAKYWKQLTHLQILLGGNGDGFLSIGEHCQLLTRLDLRGVWGPPEGVLEKFFKQCSPHLQFIYSHRSFDTATCQAIASRFSLLRVMHVPSNEMGDDAFLALASGCPDLITLWLSSSSTVTDAGIIAVAQNGALTSLECDGCSTVTDAGIRAAVECSPLLEYFGINNCTFPVSSATLHALGRHCHSLRRLAVLKTPVEVDESLTAWKAIAAGCPLLEYVNVPTCKTVGVEAIARSCPRLRCILLELAKVPALAVLALAQCCPLLEELTVCDRDIGDKEIIALARGCPALTRLDIRGTLVRGRGLTAIRNHSRKLVEIWLEEHMFPGDEFDSKFFPSGVEVNPWQYYC
jgi:hypothetical protein